MILEIVYLEQRSASLESRWRDAVQISSLTYVLRFEDARVSERESGTMFAIVPLSNSFLNEPTFDYLSSHVEGKTAAAVGTSTWERTAAVGTSARERTATVRTADRKRPSAKRSTPWESAKVVVASEVVVITSEIIVVTSEIIVATVVARISSNPIIAAIIGECCNGSVAVVWKANPRRTTGVVVTVIRTLSRCTVSDSKARNDR